MDQQLPTILAALILTGILWLVRTASKSEQRFARIETILTGADGQNGLNGEVKRVRSRVHELSDSVHEIRGKQELIRQRVDRLDPEGA